MKATTSSIIKLALAILFGVCLLDMPYGYFQLVRFLGMVGFGVLAYQAYMRQDQPFLIMWAASAVLINPIIKISLGRDLWNIVDVIWAIILIGSIFFEKTDSVL